MSRFRRGFAALGALGLAAAGCGEGEAPRVPAETESAVIRIAGSDDTYPLVRALARELRRNDPSVDIEFAPAAHTRGGIAAVALGEADIGLASRPLSPAERADDLTYLHLAHDLIVFAVHRDTPIAELTRQQLLHIWSGRITNWAQVGGPDAPIVVLDRAAHTSMKMLLRQQLFGDSLIVTPDAVVLERPNDMMAALGTIPHSIGYLSFGNALLADHPSNHLVIDGVSPTLDSFQRGEYLFHRPFGFFVGPAPSAATMRFVKFMYDDTGRRVTEAHGYAPVTMDLVVAVLPEQNLLAQERRYAPLMAYLGERLGLQTTVQLRLLPNYGAVIEEFRAGRVNAAFLGSLAFALARAQAGVEPIARPERNGISQYHSLVVTRKDSGIEDWSDLRGRSFGFVDRATTAGYLFPTVWLQEQGVADPARFLGPVTYTGSHDLLFLAVLDGDVDAGAAKDLILEEVAKTRPEIHDELRTLAISPAVPNNTFVLGRDLDFPCFRCHAMIPDRSIPGLTEPPRAADELAGLLGELLLDLHESEEGRAVLESLGADRFVRTTEDDLRAVNGMILEAGFDPAEYRP